MGILNDDMPPENSITTGVAMKTTTIGALFIALVLPPGIASKAYAASNETHTPILYDIHYAEDARVCGRLHSIINEQLEVSKLVDYSALIDFVQWQVITQEMATGRTRHFLWTATADLDNDGEAETLVKRITTNPLTSYSLYAYSRPPTKIFSSLEELERYGDYLYKFGKAFAEEIDGGNPPLYFIAFFRSYPLTKSPNYTETPEKRPSFNATASDHYLFRFEDTYYLAVDPRYYEPERSSEYSKVPWYVLFRVNVDGSLQESCILKRQQ